MIYTAELIFPHLGLPWVGLLPNYVCLLAGGVLLYLAARRLTGWFWPAWCAAACWLLSVGVQGMAVFTRMYSLMMLEGIALLYCHVVLWQVLQQGRKPSRAVWLGLFAATLAGALTQYFFGVLLFPLRAVRPLAACHAAVQNSRVLCGGRVCRAGGRVPGLSHHENPYLLRLPR